MDGVKIFKGVSSSLKYILIFLFVLLWISPFLWMVMTSFRDPAEPFSAGLFPQRSGIDQLPGSFKTFGVNDRLQEQLLCCRHGINCPL